MTCTFFGHRECFDLDTNILDHALEQLVQNGVDTFYVGHQGAFDRMVLDALKKLQASYPQITYLTVLAYLPTGKSSCDMHDGQHIFPEGLEIGPPRFAIERRNRWMIQQADHCLCYINHTWGGAYKFAKQAKKKGLTVINLGQVVL